MALPLLNAGSMNVADAVEIQDAQSIRMPAGLLGFEQVKDFRLVANPAEEPFLWLQATRAPNLSFLLISPFVVAPTYQPDIASDDAQSLGIGEPGDALLFNIVTLRGPSSATVNLKGPIVLNRHTRVARQVVLNNAANYSVQHPINPVA
jgi:flagellar assembly factor FliW